MLRFGVIGISEGNGHLYSWSAICNGYNAEVMSRCPFPLIPDYLGKEKWPEAKLGLAEVTHVWTQDPEISRNVTEASLVPNMVDRMEDLIGKVDAILLARDDAENHYEMSAPFLRAGLPVYIDKPFALSVAEAERIYAEEQYPGQVFTGSALRYSATVPKPEELAEKVGEVKYLRAATPRFWKTYSPHVVDPSLAVLGFPGFENAEVDVAVQGTTTTMQVKWPGGPVAHWVTLGGETAFYPFTVEVMGTKGSLRMELTDYFHAFKKALHLFATSIIDNTVASPKEHVMQTVRFYERGMNA